MLRSFGGKSPQVHPTAFVSEFAYVVGPMTFAGTPAAIDLSGTLRPSSNAAPAATMHQSPTDDLSFSAQLFPSRQWSPTRSAWQTTAWPSVT